MLYLIHTISRKCKDRIKSRFQFQWNKSSALRHLWDLFCRCWVRIFDYMVWVHKKHIINLEFLWIPHKGDAKTEKKTPFKNNLVFWRRDHFLWLHLKSNRQAGSQSVRQTFHKTRNVDNWYISWANSRARSTQCKIQMKTLDCSCLKHHERHCTYIQING